MEWTTIDYGGTIIYAMDFCGGVLITFRLHPETKKPKSKDMHYIPGYYIKERVAEMDGPALRPREEKKMRLALLLEEE